ncbi:MAG: SIMPL domain-containing protein [Firmicutes bacterium]|nr:SIMPL domain-containing protein [Bacillota bacterium]
MRTPIIYTLLIALLIGIAQKPSLSQPGTPISVSAVGEAQVLPDRVVVYFTLRGQGETSVEARQAVRRLFQQVAARLAPLGIGRDMLKEEVSEVVPSMPGITSSPGEDTGAHQQRRFEASFSYSLRMPISEDRLDTLFRILDALSEYTSRQGITSQGGYRGGFGGIGSAPVYQEVLVEFRVQDMERLKRQAVQDGVAKARKMAEAAARQMGKSRVKMARLDVKEPGSPELHISPSFTPGGIKWQSLRAYVQVNATFHAE